MVRAVLIVVVWAGGGVHGGCGAAEDEEEHSSPGDDVEGVDCEDEAKGGGDELQASFGADHEGLFPGVFGRELIPILIGDGGVMWF